MNDDQDRMPAIDLSRGWENLMMEAVRAMLSYPPYKNAVLPEHTARTPERVVEAYKEYFSGCEVDIHRLLTSAVFPRASYTQMIHVKDITFYSMCAHHLSLIHGTVHFAYLPGTHIVGISKIPRLVDAISRRPQVQETMTDQIVDHFMKEVKPEGCGIAVKAIHSCMQCRGARAQTAITFTTALRGAFINNQGTKQEFLTSIES